MEAGKLENNQRALAGSAQTRPGGAAGVTWTGPTSRPRPAPEVESLLAFEAEAQDFMSLPVGEFSEGLSHDRHPGRHPRRPADRRLRDRLRTRLRRDGRGLPGAARRRKVRAARSPSRCSNASSTPERMRRTFKREKEILAALAHPNIAAPARRRDDRRRRPLSGHGVRRRRADRPATARAVSSPSTTG